MKINVFFLLALVSLATFSCSEKETPAGVKFTVLKKGDGTEVAAGTYVMLHMILKDSKDSLLLNTYTEERPMVMPMPDGSMANDPGEYGIYKMMTKGDCVLFKLPAQTVFNSRRRAVPKDIDPAGLFTFVVHLKETWTFDEAKQYEQSQMEKMQRKVFVTDSIMISSHLKEKGLEALTTPSGLRYIIQKEGKGEKAAPGKTAYVQYAGYTLDGKLFDTSLSSVAKANKLDNGASDQPYPVVVNTRSVISGWDEILQLMNKGMKVRVYIPSALGYGPQGNAPIPPNAVLVFDMEVTDIK